MWDRSFDRPLYLLLLRSGVPEQALKAERWNEIYGYEQEQLGEKWLLDEVLPQLSAAKPQKIGTLDPEELSVLQNKVVSRQLTKGRPPKFVDERYMTSLYEETTALADCVFD